MCKGVCARGMCGHFWVCAGGMCKESGTLAIRYRKTLPKPRKYIVFSRFCQDLPQILAAYLYLRTFLHILLRLLDGKGWRSRKEEVPGLEAWA